MTARRLNRFSVILDLAIGAAGYSEKTLLQAIGETITPKKKGAIRSWRRGATYPRINKYLRILEKIEGRLALEQGRLMNMVKGTSSALFIDVKASHPQDLQLMRWHLPADFDLRRESEKREILDWITGNVLYGATEYGKYQSVATRHRFGIVFPTLPRELGGRAWIGDRARKSTRYLTIPAPPRLIEEFKSLLAFKTATLPPKDLQRRGRWQNTTAETQVKRYGLALGLFSAAREGEIKGLGVPVSDLTLGLFVIPELWEWYLSWYEKRRGFHSSAELNILYEVKSQMRNPTGWVRQHPELAQRLKPIAGIVTAKEIRWLQRHWEQACNRSFEYALQRINELIPVARLHRDPFVAIMPVLTAKSPLRLYKKIGDEILRRMPDEKEQPLRAATAVRRYLIFRFALHLGIRQRNLRELLLTPPGAKPRDIRELERLRRGEVRWNHKHRSWEVFIPAVGIKNGASSFFKWRPYQITLPDREDLYWWIDRYIKKHRKVLLRGRPDPGAFFIRSSWWGPLQNPEYDVNSFYSNWKEMIQRYGIFNPYTKRGAIKGLLPHGPHSVRDVLATHLLKTTGSYELASFAIQDSVESVMRHYARFLPHEKVARAADELNKVWRA